MRKVVSFLSLSHLNVSEPPLSRIICLDSARPIPLPDFLVVKNGTKIWEAISSGISGPSLVMSTVTLSSPLFLAVTVTLCPWPDSEMAWTAFFSRLVITCEMSFSSA